MKKTKKKDVALELDFERAERKEHDKKRRLTAAERAVIANRKAQAAVLWMMYYSGDLELQDVSIPARGGSVINKTMLLSHKSIYSVDE